MLNVVVRGIAAKPQTAFRDSTSRLLPDIP